MCLLYKTAFTVASAQLDVPFIAGSSFFLQTAHILFYKHMLCPFPVIESLDVVCLCVCREIIENTKLHIDIIEELLRNGNWGEQIPPIPSPNPIPLRE